MRYLFVKAALLAMLALAPLSCGTARRGEPLRGPLVVNSPTVAMGQVAYMNHCHQCHPGGEAGLGPALNNKAILPRWIIKVQARRGFGVMPAFPPSVISRPALKALVEYIKIVQHH